MKRNNSYSNKKRKKMDEYLGKKIVVDPKIMVGKPIIKGTRIPVDAIIQRIADGMSIKEILEDYPQPHQRRYKSSPAIHWGNSERRRHNTNTNKNLRRECDF